jgi:hypothetical protein
MSQSAKTLLWIIIIVLVLLALVVFLGKGDRIGTSGREDVEEIAPGQTKTTAEVGSIVSGFPERLILDENARTTDSYSIAYADEGIKQPVVEYTTEASPDDIMDLYRLYFISNGWVTRQDENFSEEDVFTAFVYAVRENEEANVTVISNQGNTRVIIAYLNRVGEAEE